MLRLYLGIVGWKFPSKGDDPCRFESETTTFVDWWQEVMRYGITLGIHGIVKASCGWVA